MHFYVSSCLKKVEKTEYEATTGKCSMNSEEKKRWPLWVKDDLCWTLSVSSNLTDRSVGDCVDTLHHAPTPLPAAFVILPYRARKSNWMHRRTRPVPAGMGWQSSDTQITSWIPSFSCPVPSSPQAGHGPRPASFPVQPVCWKKWNITLVDFT